MHTNLSALIVAATTVLGGRAIAETVAVTGEVVSVSCYLQNKSNVGKTGYVCAIGDVKWEGNPPGLLTKNGKLYQLTGPLVANNNAKVGPHIGHIVTITGDVTTHDGMMMLSASDLKIVSN